MNDILSEEQQQIESIKNWIQEHMLSLIAAVVIFCGIVFGPDLYQNYKNSKIFPASDTYEQFSLAVAQASAGVVATDAELELVDALADRLVEEYGDSQYAFLASLRAAKLSADLGNYEVALSRLKWAEQNTGNKADQLLVNHRLALVEAQLGDTDSALGRLSSPNRHFASIYAETRGDIYAATGQRDEAIVAYEEAVEAADVANASQQSGAKLKLNNFLEGLGSITGVEVIEEPSELTNEGTAIEEIGAEPSTEEGSVTE